MKKICALLLVVTMLFGFIETVSAKKVEFKDFLEGAVCKTSYDDTSIYNKSKQGYPYLISKSNNAFKVYVACIGFPAYSDISTIESCFLLNDITTKGNFYNKEKGKVILSSKLKSTNCDKWVFVSLKTPQKDIICGDWIRLRKGKKYKYNKTFNLKDIPSYGYPVSICFQYGGEFGDAKSELYSYISGGINSIKQNRDPSGESTIIVCENTSLIRKPSVPKAKIIYVSKNKKNVTIKYKKLNGCKYEIQISKGKKFKTSNTKTYSTSKALYKAKIKGKKLFVRIRPYYVHNGFKIFGKWTSTKKIK